ncbi:SWIM zinc finger family protein [Aeromonas allosaccharophila]|uniref:SWIM zinc finger family protein n=1 Tax=Aeromonas allosaccharophila TaxID=656 RepID=UPI003D211A38
MVRSTSHSAELIDIAELKAQSGDASFAKGVKLASQGAVQQLAQDGETITARVQGSHLYRVRLECGRTMVSHCNCPAADYQTLCKHGVATALAFNMQLSGLDGEEGAVAQVPDARASLRAERVPGDEYD